MALIELKDVTKKYDKSTTALRHIDLSVNSGEFVYLVGPSGAGKSSLIRLFYQEEKLTSGSMKVGEFDLTRLRKKDVPLLRRSIGVVFQDYKLLPKKTAFENVAYSMEVIGEKCVCKGRSSSGGKNQRIQFGNFQDIGSAGNSESNDPCVERTDGCWKYLYLYAGCIRSAISGICQ